MARDGIEPELLIRPQRFINPVFTVTRKSQDWKQTSRAEI
jgi:hypothetical protein